MTKVLTNVLTSCNDSHMNTTITKATDLKLGDMIALRYDGFRKVTGIDITPAAVRIRTGRSQRWSRAKHDATFEVAP